MAQMTFGTVLREARERKGYDLPTAARRLRIRPDILRAIEEDDFSRMPPRGYARNMVNAYARLLGLNPTEVTRMYLDEAYAYQVGRARNEAEPSQFDMGAPSRSKRQRERPAAQAERPPRQNAFGRTLYDDRTEYGRGGSGRRTPEERTHPSRHAALPNAQYTNFYAGPKAPGAVKSRLPLVIAGAAILILLIIILVLAFGNKGSSAEENVPSVPITGLNDTTQDQGQESGGNENAQQDATVTEVAPTKAVLSYKIASGAAPYIEVYENGASAPSVAETMAGPVTESVDVTGTLRIDTPQPDSVEVQVDGQTVELVDDDGDSVYSYTVDFAAILKQWNDAHPNASTSGTSNTQTTA